MRVVSRILTSSLDELWPPDVKGHHHHRPYALGVVAVRFNLIASFGKKREEYLLPGAPGDDIFIILSTSAEAGEAANGDGFASTREKNRFVARGHVRAYLKYSRTSNKLSSEGEGFNNDGHCNHFIDSNSLLGAGNCPRVYNRLYKE